MQVELFDKVTQVIQWLGCYLNNRHIKTQLASSLRCYSNFDHVDSNGKGALLGSISKQAY